MRFHGPTLGESKVPCERRRVLGAWRVPEGVDRRCGPPTRVSRPERHLAVRVIPAAQECVSRIVSDSTPPHLPKDPDPSTIFQICRTVAARGRTWRLSPIRHASTHCWRLAPPVRAPARVRARPRASRDRHRALSSMTVSQTPYSIARSSSFATSRFDVLIRRQSRSCRRGNRSRPRRSVLRRRSLSFTAPCLLLLLPHRSAALAKSGATCSSSLSLRLSGYVD